MVYTALGACVGGGNGDSDSGDCRRGSRVWIQAVEPVADLAACAEDGQRHGLMGLHGSQLSVRRGGFGDHHTITYNATIGARGKAQWVREAVLLAEMGGVRIEQCTSASSAAIGACGKAGAWFWLEKPLDGWNTTTYSAAASACEKTGKWTRIEELLAKMAEEYARDTITYHAAISACEKGGQWFWALGPTAVMLHGRVQLLGGQWLQALGLLDWLPLSRGQWDTITRCAALSACVQGSFCLQACSHGTKWPARGRAVGRGSAVPVIAGGGSAWLGLIGARARVQAARAAVRSRSPRGLHRAATQPPARSASRRCGTFFPSGLRAQGVFHGERRASPPALPPESV